MPFQIHICMLIILLGSIYPTLCNVKSPEQKAGVIQYTIP